ncbi:MAG: LysE family transporter [Rhodobacteraceae bacterium]|nr:LysE family transporter [Paracoccaceae bacterium]
MAVFLLMLTPGPAILMIINAGINNGFRSSIQFVFGIIVGANIVALMVILGLASIILNYPTLRLILLILSSAYLVYLASNILRQSIITSANLPKKKLKFSNGILIQLLNPKNYLVQIALFSGFSIWPSDFILEVIFKIVIANLIWLPGHMAWLLLGASVKTFNFSDVAMKFINLIMALLILSVIFLAILNY